MRLCFFTIWREDSDTVGINMKIRNQVKAFSNLGCDSYFCVSASSSVKLYMFNAETRQLDLVEEKRFSKRADHEKNNKGMARKFSSLFRLNECLDFMDDMNESNTFDIIYVRRIQPFTGTTKRKIQKWSNQGSKIFWEIPTGGEKPITLSNKLVKLQEDHRYQQLKNHMKVVAISSGQGGMDDFILINNGVDCETIKLKECGMHYSLNIICLATFNYWHGYDRMLNGLAEYYKNGNEKDVQVYMVGNGQIEDLQKLSAELGLDSRVHFLGVKTGKELDKIFDNMDIAFGNLGFFRKGVTSDTSIKIREYCARGIPFVTALKVNDFPDDFPYIKKVPMDESYINMSDIITFVNGLDLKKASQDMRAYAEKNLSWEKQLSIVLDAAKAE